MAGLLASVMKSAVMPRSARGAEKPRRASTPAAAPEQPRGVQFRRETSIASVHYIDSAAPPERHLSDEPGMQYMEADVKERKVKSLRHKRNSQSPLANRLRMAPTPMRSLPVNTGVAPASSVLKRVSQAEALFNAPARGFSDARVSTPDPTTSRYVPRSPGGPVTNAPEDGRAAMSATGSSNFGSTWKSGTIKSALSREVQSPGSSSTTPLKEAALELPRNSLRELREAELGLKEAEEADAEKLGQPSTTSPKEDKLGLSTCSVDSEEEEAWRVIVM